MLELLKAFPAIWMVVGVVIASGAFLIGNRYIFRWQRSATENLVNTLQRQIDAEKADKEDYKTKLHGEREAHNSCVLKIKELEMKPDITALFHANQEFYVQQAEAQAQLAKLSKDTLEAMTPIYTSMKTMGDGIAELLRRTSKK